MTTRTLRAILTRPADEVLAHLSDCAAHPVHSPDIRSITSAGDGRTTWKLAFRGASVAWIQQESVHPDRITFEQVAGDFIHLSGSWTVARHPRGCEVTYAVDYRTSVAHLAGAVDPVIGRVLVRAATVVLAAVAETPEIVDGDQWLYDLPPDLTARLPKTSASRR